MSHHYRINGSMIQQFAGKSVSLIGTVSKVHPSGNVIDLETTDKQHIVVRLNEAVSRLEIEKKKILCFSPD